MAKCKVCKVNIPDGTEYCSNCQDKGNAKANESYLDSLLNSVKNTVPVSEVIYKKKADSTDATKEQTAPTLDIQSEPEDEDYSDYDIDLSDIEDFDEFFGNDEEFDEEDEISIGDEQLFGDSLSDLFQDSDSDLEPVRSYAPTEDMPELDEEITGPTDVMPEPEVEADLFDEDVQETDNRRLYKEEDAPVESMSEQYSPDEEAEAEDEENDLDPDINELLKSLNLQDEGSDDSPAREAAPIPKAASAPAQFSTEVGEADSDTTSTYATRQEDDIEEISSDDDDILNLLSQISSDDPVSADVMAINDLLSGNPAQKPDKDGSLSDVGEVFSDALKVVSSLNDPEMNEEELLNSLSDLGDNKKEKKRQKKVFKKEIDVTEEVTVKKSKKSLLKTLFGNVPDENAAKKKAKVKTMTMEDAVAKSEGKKSKRKGKKGAPEVIDEEQLDSPNGRASDDKGSTVKEAKKEKKEKKKKTKEIIQVIDEIEEDEGRINRLGASIVFMFFGLLLILLLVGTNMVSYTLSIEHATDYFNDQKYNQAYNEVYGIDIKDEDIVIYDKIMTVMFVNKQLNSYNNFYSLNKYPEALDSLLKGLSRYEKYIELATILGIETDLNYVRSQILAELKSVFHISEAEAMKLIATEDMEEYSMAVYNVVHERVNN